MLTNNHLIEIRGIVQDAATVLAITARSPDANLNPATIDILSREAGRLLTVSRYLDEYINDDATYHPTEWQFP